MGTSSNTPQEEFKMKIHQMFATFINSQKTMSGTELIWL